MLRCVTVNHCQAAHSATCTGRLHCSAGPEGRHWAARASRRLALAGTVALQCKPNSGTGKALGIQCHKSVKHWALQVRPTPPFHYILLTFRQDNALKSL